VLVFVGLKMAVAAWYHVNTFLSLGVIVLILAAAIVFSEMRERKLRAAGEAPHAPHEPL
jgi:predicted tellurium resistance membrane protein TerC